MSYSAPDAPSRDVTPRVYSSHDPPAALREAYERDGFVILTDIFSNSSMNAKKEDAQEDLMNQLRVAAEDTVTLTRKGEWPYRRVVGKQFPPFNIDSKDYWGVQHLLHPSCPHSDLFAEFYASSPLLDVSAILIGLDPSEEGVRKMQLELFNLLINPTTHYFALSWHRDDIRPEISIDDERKALRTPTHGIQWNAALYDDDCLFVVPGTHRRIRTHEEKQANHAKAPEAKKCAEGYGGAGEELDVACSADPPTTLRVKLKAGEAVFYSQRILHRASYLPTKQRATLHGCYGCTGEEHSAAASERARNVLQHGVEWMRDEAFGAGLPPRLQPMWRNLINMERQNAGKSLGYSLEG
ncbi:hypothetical protein K437DRAFT_276610 [Tilletiaria anomala UBC 951]|uniref:Phytanoyl-CoA dioxygenase family protein n=1 Tax=Tilletiaria anomala (strain ATCC 24038 / CBS 436.72 / UBC 951) TaxID=1037660 RepID=A0A066V710_TILAU|nr:uncharacterized protein K437DRAFT_276610 [Tilletiaria anomala UBC 951]KDN37256.1 hypothetical protein K437DRAFT_276610 [Tilletiaria anomala UBC 951]